jgi:hypothetical protein
MKTAEYEKLNEALYLWFTQQREKGSPLSGPINKEKRGVVTGRHVIDKSVEGHCSQKKVVKKSSNQNIRFFFVEICSVVLHLQISYIFLCHKFY